MDVINPATEKDIKKYSQEKVYSAVETAEFYKSVFYYFYIEILNSCTIYTSNLSYCMHLCYIILIYICINNFFLSFLIFYHS